MFSPIFDRISSSLIEKCTQENSGMSQVGISNGNPIRFGNTVIRH